MTLLSVLGAHATALPLSHPFPVHELKYIMDQSQASMLLSSPKFSKKAEELLASGLEGSPKHVRCEKKLSTSEIRKVTLEGLSDGQGAMMLYTSGTTARPVSDIASRWYYELTIYRKEFYSHWQS